MNPDREIDRLLDEALAATFPASDPVAISVRGWPDPRVEIEARDQARPAPPPVAAAD